jgi:predicted enzyme related to lactoylglutathione lyase
MTHSTATGRRAARTADGEGEAWWFYGDRAVLRSPAGVVPVIIEHHVGPGATLDQAEKLGGTIVQPAQQVPGVTFGVFADPQGHQIGIAAQA